MLTKNRKKQMEGVDLDKSYPINEAIKLIKEKKFVKFDLVSTPVTKPIVHVERIHSVRKSNCWALLA